MTNTRDIICEGGCGTVLGHLTGKPEWTEEKWADALMGYRCTVCPHPAPAPAPEETP